MADSFMVGVLPCCAPWVWSSKSVQADAGLSPCRCTAIASSTRWSGINVRSLRMCRQGDSGRASLPTPQSSDH